MTVERTHQNGREVMTGAEFIARYGERGRGGRPNKHGVAPAGERVVDGITFDSKLEAGRYRELKALRDGGDAEVRHFEWQVRFHLGVPENVYVVDFVIWTRDGAAWAEDVKGHETPKFLRDLKLWRAYGPMDLMILKGRPGAWVRRNIKGGAIG